MEVDPASEHPVDDNGEPAAGLQMQLNILSTIKAAQLQNGLKHGDYGRYRQYCARRLRSLYRALKFLHGKGRYQKKKLEAPQVTDVRHLHIMLVSAERAWAHAMQLKQEAEAGGGEDGPDPRKRHHALRRLAKAGVWAAQLARLAGAACDTRSALEAEGYAAWMAGNVLMERESDWEKAMSAFSRAKQLFGELSKVGDAESQGHCGAMLEELGPALRYCAYQISRAGGAPPDPAALAALAEGGEGGGAGGLLQSKLASLAAEAQSAQAASTSSFEWRGLSAGVTLERVRVPLHTAAELAAGLDAAMDTDGDQALEGVLPPHDRLINAYNEARAATRSALRTAQAGGQAGDAELADADELSRLEVALTGRILEASMTRAQLAAADAAARHNAGLARLAAGKGGRAAGAAAGAKERPAKAEDLVRLHTTLCQLASELEEHASHMGGRSGEGLAAAAAARGAVHAAWRTYYAAHAALAAGGPAQDAAARRAEAAALFRRAGKRAAEAAEAIQELPKSEAAAWAALPGLQGLQSSVAAYLLVASAEAAAAGAAGADSAAAGLQALGLAGGAQQQPQQPQFLADSLDSWESFSGGAAAAAAGGAKAPRLFQGPYALAAIAPRPIMLDSAAGEVGYPDVAHRVKRRKVAPAAGAATGTFARLFGGWGS